LRRAGRAEMSGRGRCPVGLTAEFQKRVFETAGSVSPAMSSTPEGVFQRLFAPERGEGGPHRRAGAQPFPLDRR
jgi:hypothetical protein